MNDPKRWLDEGGGATFEERELLDAGRRAALPKALRKRVWLGVATGAAGLGAASEAAGALGSAGAASKGVFSAFVSGAAAKGVLAIALVGTAGLGVATLRSSSKPVPVATVGRAAPTLDAPPAVETSASGEKSADAPMRVAPAPVPAGVAKPLAVSRGAGSRSASTAAVPNDEDVRPREAPLESRTASRLREESAAVLSIRKTLLAGDAVLALRMLDRARAEFPNGALVEEREALAVRALVASGQNELARKRGEAFLHAFPRSPHASEVRSVLGP